MAEATQKNAPRIVGTVRVPKDPEKPDSPRDVFRAGDEDALAAVLEERPELTPGLLRVGVIRGDWGVAKPKEVARVGDHALPEDFPGLDALAKHSPPITTGAEARAFSGDWTSIDGVGEKTAEKIRARLAA